jgi:hypothetical protein
MKRNGWTLSLFIFAALAGCAGSKEALYKKGPMHPEGNFDGVYQSDFGRLEITVQGNKATGLYEKNEKAGRIEGEIKRNLLYFRWTEWDSGLKGKPRETTGRGVFQYMVDEYPMADGRVKTSHWLKGFWAYGRDDPTNAWTAYKLGKKAKKKLQPFDPDEGWGEEEEYEESSFDDTGSGDEGGGDYGGGGDEESAPPPADEGGGGSGADDPDIF